MQKGVNSRGFTQEAPTEHSINLMVSNETLQHEMREKGGEGKQCSDVQPIACSMKGFAQQRGRRPRRQGRVVFGNDLVVTATVSANDFSTPVISVELLDDTDVVIGTGVLVSGTNLDGQWTITVPGLAIGEYQVRVKASDGVDPAARTDLITIFVPNP